MDDESCLFGEDFDILRDSEDLIIRKMESGALGVSLLIS